MRSQTLVRVFQVLTGILLGVAAVLWFLSSEARRGEGEGDYFLADPLEAPEFTLASSEGREVSSADFSGKILVLFFGYTSCPDVCPLTLSRLTRVFEEMGEASRRIQVLFISVDPQRDTPDRLRDYLASFHPSFLGLTGTEEEVREVAEGFGAYFARRGDEPDYVVDHTARTFVIDGSGRIPLTFPVTATAEQMERDLSLLLGGER